MLLNKAQSDDCNGQEMHGDRTIIKNYSVGKQHLGTSRLIWEECVVKDVVVMTFGVQWKEAVDDRNRRRNICLEGWS